MVEMGIVITDKDKKNNANWYPISKSEPTLMRVLL